MEASSLRAGSSGIPTLVAPGPPAFVPGAPTAPDRLPPSAAPARPFADLLRHSRAEATLPVPAPAEATPASEGDGTASESAGDVASGPDKPATPAKPKAKAVVAGRNAAGMERTDGDLAEAPRRGPRATDATTGDDRLRPALASLADERLVVLPPSTRTGAAEASADDDAIASSDDASSRDSLRRTGRAAADDGRRDASSRGLRGETPAEAGATTPAAAVPGALAEQAPLHDVAAGRFTLDGATPPAVAIATPVATGLAGDAHRLDGTPPTVALATPVDSPQFAGALGLQVSLLTKDGVQQAELHLNPAEMGPVSIRIRVDGSEARVEFGADLAATREVIEGGLPELASALREAGFTLAGGGISQHAGPRDRSDDAQPAASPRRQDDGAAVPASAGIDRALRRAAAGGVDVYA
jgi:flagellar hook-length control protein FliK